MEKPPILEYQTPPQPSEARRLAASITLTNGIIDLILGTGWFVLFGPLLYFPAPPFTALDWAWPISTTLCGFIFTIGGAFVRRFRRSWEIAIMTFAAMQMAVIILLIGRGVDRGIDFRGTTEWNSVLLFLLSIHLVATGMVFFLMYRTHRGA